MKGFIVGKMKPGRIVDIIWKHLLNISYKYDICQIFWHPFIHSVVALVFNRMKLFHI
jgi:hypothetical protein